MIISSTAFLIRLIGIKKEFFDEEFISQKEYNDIFWHVTQYLYEYKYDVIIANDINREIFNCSNGVITLNNNISYKEVLESTEEELLKLDEKKYSIFSNKKILINMLKETKLKSLKKLIENNYLDENDIKNIISTR